MPGRGCDPTISFDKLRAEARPATFIGERATLGGIGNIGDDPLFVDADGADDILGSPDDNARLTAESPARDTGNIAALPPDQFDIDGDGDIDEPIPFDIGNNPRVVGESVDMGAFEFPAAYDSRLAAYEGCSAVISKCVHN